MKRAFVLGGAVAGIVAIVLVFTLRDGSDPKQAQAPDAGSVTRVVPSDPRHFGTPDAGPRPLPGPVIDAGPTIVTEVDNEMVEGRPPELHTRGRRAWRLDALIGDDYWKPQHEVHVFTSDGMDFIVRGAGREGDDVILVERDDGTRYVGWLVEGAEQYGEELGDAEKPAERLENVVRISVQAQPTRGQQPPASLAIVIDGVTWRTLAATDVASLASRNVPSKDGGTSPALDLARDLDGQTELLQITAEDQTGPATPPIAGAIPVIYANRRQRFKLAWLDAAGKPIEGAKYREISRIELRRR